MSDLNELAQEVNRISTEHGFWPEEGRNFGEMIALAHSELSEALEEHRSDKPAHYYSFKGSPAVHFPVFYIGGKAFKDPHGNEPLTNEDLEKAGMTKKPEGVAVELADCLIRVLDTMHSLGVDIDEIVAEKMAYNDSRPHKHGRAY